MLRTIMVRTTVLLLLSAAFLVARDPAPVYTGEIVDAATKKPIPGAIVTVGTTVVITGADGAFRIEATGEEILGESVRIPACESQRFSFEVGPSEKSNWRRFAPRRSIFRFTA